MLFEADFSRYTRQYSTFILNIRNLEESIRTFVDAFTNVRITRIVRNNVLSRWNRYETTITVLAKFKTNQKIHVTVTRCLENVYDKYEMLGQHPLLIYTL